MSDRNFTCPYCHSEDIVRFSVLYENGTSDIDLYTSGVGVGGGVGVGAAHSTGSSQTLAASSTRPPVKRHPVRPIIAGIILYPIFLGLIQVPLISNFQQSEFLVLCTFLLTTVIYIAIVAAFFHRSRKWNREQYPKLCHDWSHSFYCKRCGNTFRLNV